MVDIFFEIHGRPSMNRACFLCECQPPETSSTCGTQKHQITSRAPELKWDVEIHSKNRLYYLPFNLARSQMSSSKSFTPTLVAKWGHLPSSTDNLKQQVPTDQRWAHHSSTGKAPGFCRTSWWLKSPTNPFEKYDRQIGSSPQGEGVNMNNIWKLPP